METIKKYKKLLILIIIVLVVVLIVKVIYDKRGSLLNSGLTGNYNIIYKKYGVNEYSTVNISDEQLANIYLNNFRYYLFYETEYAYELLDDDYKNIRFGSIDNFKNYVSSINYNDISVDEYSISYGKSFIEVHTKNNENFIFKINGILDYKVYLDNYTVEILVK